MRNIWRKLAVVVLALLLPVSATAQEVTLRAEVWADNWFAFFADGKLIKEDSVPITTERSFNAETFSFVARLPVTFAFIAKDYKADDTGLEYIGTRRQQIGDGGLIAQFTDAETGRLIAVTNSDWRCQVIHDAPLDSKCAAEKTPVAGRKPCEFTSSDEPPNWKNKDFDDSKWARATLYPAAEVRPKDGYDNVNWNPAAKFIWGPDLKTNNTVLCRLRVDGPLK